VKGRREREKVIPWFLVWEKDGLGLDKEFQTRTGFWRQQMSFVLDQ
jgi:hypothetical protein